MPLIRDGLLALSTHHLVRALVVRFPPSRRVSRRFVAGETLGEAIAVAKTLNAQSLKVSLDHLGENVVQPQEAHDAKSDYLSALCAIDANGLAAHVSVKLTQLGLALDSELCLDNIREIVDHARKVGTFVRIDMEDARYTQPTLGIYRTLRETFDNVGIVIQSYLYRSETDIQTLLAMDANVRLCKGAYKEPATIAFPKKWDVDANYIKLARMFLNGEGQHRRAHLALATHDEKIIAWAKEHTAASHIERARFEFQMLYGIRSDLQYRLAAEGYTVRVYVPYGSHWYPYFMRRLAERPANVLFLFRNLFR